jgi:hypothetical protein
MNKQKVLWTVDAVFLKAFGVTLLHFKVDKINWGSYSLKKIIFAQMGNTHSAKPQKSLEKPGFLGIPGKFSSLIIVSSKHFNS